MPKRKDTYEELSPYTQGRYRLQYSRSEGHPVDKTEAARMFNQGFSIYTRLPGIKESWWKNKYHATIWDTHGKVDFKGKTLTGVDRGLAFRAQFSKALRDLKARGAESTQPTGQGDRFEESLDLENDQQIGQIMEYDIDAILSGDPYVMEALGNDLEGVDNIRGFGYV